MGQFTKKLLVFLADKKDTVWPDSQISDSYEPVNQNIQRDQSDS